MMLKINWSEITQSFIGVLSIFLGYLARKVLTFEM